MGILLLDFASHTSGCGEILTLLLLPISGMLPTLSFCISVSALIPRNSKCGMLTNLLVNSFM